MNCSENWKERGGSCAVIVANALEVAVVLGPRRTGSFRALKTSARNLNLAASVRRKLLFTEKSHRRCESNRTFEKRRGKVRTLDAGVKEVAAPRVAKTLVLNQRSAL